jgi:hypothetical protein
MATVACPYCYHPINQGKLAYQCLGRGVPGGPRCAKREDELRQQLTNVRTAAYPTFVPASRRLFGSVGKGGAGKSLCPHCGGRTGLRACPACHTPLSSIFAESRSPLVGMVGGKGAGKTVYLSVLYHELCTTVRRRFLADIRLTGDQQGGAGSPRQWLENYVEQLFTHRRLFEQTAESRGGLRAPVVIEWRQPQRGLRFPKLGPPKLGRRRFGTTVLSFYDAAGEDLTSQDRVHTQAYLGVANGLILLLDPWQLPGAMDRIDVPAAAVREAEPPLEVLNRITELLRVSHEVKASRLVKVPLAVVFAKMDAFFPVLGGNHPLLAKSATLPGYDEVGGQDTHEHVRSLLHEYGADDIDAHLMHNYATFRYFAVSALGATPDYAAKAVDPGGVQPFRVEEPLLWLLKGFGVIDRSRA